jgi:hypothetical protein
LQIGCINDQTPCPMDDLCSKKTLSQLQIIFNCRKFSRCSNSFPTSLQRMAAKPGWVASKAGRAAGES